jgi:hypothetical protein
MLHLSATGLRMDGCAAIEIEGIMKRKTAIQRVRTAASGMSQLPYRRAPVIREVHHVEQ